MRHEVIEIDIERRRVKVEPLGKSAHWEPFDQLLIATGARPIRPPIPGIDARGIHGLGTLQSGIDLRHALEEGRAKKAVIVGGGYIGLEMAEAFLRRGMKVSLVEMAPQVMRTLDADMAKPVAQALRETGVQLYLSERVEGFDVAEGSVRAVVTDRQTIATDIVVLGMGVSPNSELAIQAGIPVGVRDAIVVDDRMRTEIEGVWAAGDCVQTHHLISKRPFYVALGTIANRQGRVAGINLGAGEARFPGALGTAITKFVDLEMARSGLQKSELAKLDIPHVSARITSHTKARYFTDSGSITVKLWAEQGSGRLLGGQIIGGPGAAKRIDTIATALQAHLSVEEMINLDLSYAPPFSPVWDPVIIAARQLAKKV